MKHEQYKEGKLQHQDPVIGISQWQNDNDFICYWSSCFEEDMADAERYDKAQAEHDAFRAKCNNWTDEERERLGKEMITLFNGDLGNKSS